MPITQAYLSGRKVTNDMFSEDANMFNESENPGYEECLVEVKWLTEVHKRDVIGSGVCYGRPYFSTQLVTCSLKNQIETKIELERKFNLNFESLLNDIFIPEENDEELYLEGRELLKIHKQKERNKELVKRVKEIRYNLDNRLCCDVCSFSFVDKYGLIGNGFIEAHHKTPISELTEETQTNISDIALVCSNCHRMLHRQRPWISVEQLKDLIENNY